MDPAIIGALISGIAMIGTTIFSQFFNKKSREEETAASERIAQQQADIAREGMQKDMAISEKNVQAQKEINQANIQNQNMLNSVMQTREDNAIQRRANDLQMAGINPMLAGLQGAQASAGQFALQQAPIADTTIGSNFAKNMNDVLGALAQRKSDQKHQERAERTAMADRATEAIKAINEIATSEHQRKLLKEQAEKTSGETKKVFEDTVKTQKEVQHIESQISTEELQRSLLREQITTEPINRALTKAKTKAEFEHIKQMQQAIVNMKQEKKNLVAKELETLNNIEVSQHVKEKLKEETANLMITGDMLQFQRNMQKLDKVTETSQKYVNMFTQLLRTIFTGGLLK